MTGFVILGIAVAAILGLGFFAFVCVLVAGFMGGRKSESNSNPIQAQGLHWMEMLNKEGMLKAAGILTDRVANAQANAFAGNFAASVQSPN